MTLVIEVFDIIIFQPATCRRPWMLWITRCLRGTEAIVIFKENDIGIDLIVIRKFRTTGSFLGKLQMSEKAGRGWRCQVANANMSLRSRFGYGA